jgi:hypothetical protein
VKKEKSKLLCTILLSILLVVPFFPNVRADYNEYFSDDFGSGTFDAWSSTYGSPTVSNGIATFTVSGDVPNSCYIAKEQLSISSTNPFTVSANVSFNTIPTGGQGNYNIFFTQILDPASPETAMVYAFVDGSSRFGLWLGAWPNYMTVYDYTQFVQADTYYNVTIQLDNINQQVKLIVDDVTTITQSYTAYSAFHNSTTVVLIEGIVQNWYQTTVQVKMDYVTVNSGTTSEVMLPLHVSGNQLLDSNNDVITLRGIDYTYFTDGPCGSWMLPDGNIDWNTWDTDDVDVNLDAIQCWGCNSVRVLATVQWWTENTDDFQSHIEYFISQAQARGIYVDFTFWRLADGEDQVTMPYPPYVNSTIITSANDFVNLWINVSDTLKVYPNVIFELWNEPTGDTEYASSWFNTTQQCINSIRNTGATNLVLVQWDYKVALDYQWYQAGSLWGLNWIDEYPLSDSLGNIVYSTHIYRDGFYNWNTIDGWAISTADMTWALNETGVIGLDKPLIIGEIGCRVGSIWPPIDVDSEKEWFNNTLEILNEYGIGYNAWAWAPWRDGYVWAGMYFGLVPAYAQNYEPNQSGEILLKNING